MAALVGDLLLWLVAARLKVALIGILGTAALVIGGLIGSGIVGLLFGSLIWAAATAMLYAAFGRWTFGPPPLA